jgi:FKBP-type peptidyl-prolyl cis-trans isomerase SlpA
MTIGLNDRITLHYRLSCGEAVLADTFGDAPETFQLGCGEMDPRLEYALKDLAVGDHSTLNLAPEQAFGAVDADKVQSLPLTDLGAFTEGLTVGQALRFSLPNGTQLEGEVIGLDATHARIDFNHPLAGRPVAFEVHILDIQKP